MKRRRFLALTTVLALTPFIRVDGLKAAPLAVRKFADEEPYGFIPRHQRCTKWEKPKDKDK